MQGKVQADERNIAEITARFGGRIEQLFVNFTGQHVRKGEKLATIYSPELVTAQRELLEVLTFKERRPSLYKAVRNKLKLWDLTDKQISAIEEKGEPQFYFDVLSPISGTVILRHVAIGDYVKEGTALFKVVDLSKVWVMFDAYESDLPWIKLVGFLFFIGFSASSNSLKNLWSTNSLFFNWLRVSSHCSARIPLFAILFFNFSWIVIFSSFESTDELPTLNNNSTLVDTLFTDCPPGPLLRLYLYFTSEMSFSIIHQMYVFYKIL